MSIDLLDIATQNHRHRYICMCCVSDFDLQLLTKDAKSLLIDCRQSLTGKGRLLIVLNNIWTANNPACNLPLFSFLTNNFPTSQKVSLVITDIYYGER